MSIKKRRMNLEHLDSRQLMTATLGMEIGEAMASEPNQPTQKAVPAMVASVKAEVATPMSSETVAPPAKSLNSAAVDSVFDQLGEAPGHKLNDKLGLFGGAGLGIKRELSFSLPDLRFNPGSEGFVHSDEVPGNTPFGPTILANENSDEGENKEEEQKEKDERTDEEIAEEEIKFKAPSRFWIHEEAGTRVVRFVP